VTRTSDTPLRKRIRENCCPFTGLSPAEMEKHILAIELAINRAKARAR
jgi:hypothetical protein